MTVGWANNVHLHLRTYVMPHYCTSSCTCTHAVATLRYVLLHLHTYVMLRYCTFSCTCTHMSCHALDNLAKINMQKSGWIQLGMNTRRAGHKDIPTFRRTWILMLLCVRLVNWQPLQEEKQQLLLQRHISMMFLDILTLMLLLLMMMMMVMMMIIMIMMMMIYDDDDDDGDDDDIWYMNPRWHFPGDPVQATCSYEPGDPHFEPTKCHSHDLKTTYKMQTLPSICAKIRSLQNAISKKWIAILRLYFWQQDFATSIL